MRGMRGTVLTALVAFAAAACGGDAGEQQDTGTSDTAGTTTGSQQPTGTTGTPTTANLPQGVTQEMVTQGQQIFTGAGNCFTCHGMNGEGTALAPNLTDSEWINIDGSYDQIVQNVRTGVPQPKQHPAPMPPMGGAQLSEDQIRAVSAYVFSLSQS